MSDGLSSVGAAAGGRGAKKAEDPCCVCGLEECADASSIPGEKKLRQLLRNATVAVLSTKTTAPPTQLEALSGLACTVRPMPKIVRS